MNCFQKSYLWLLNTTPRAEYATLYPLWIAFKNLIFDYWTQPTIEKATGIKSCELLSKILSLTIEHNIGSSGYSAQIVVNCFQKSYLWLLNTTFLNRKRQKAGCELLSKILSLTIEHNTNTTLWSHLLVVNCFQKSYLWLLNTTCLRWVLSFPALWIAFKNLIFDYWTQHDERIEKGGGGCELLSKILSLTIEHNFPRRVTLRASVVNCFQKSYLWLLNTTADIVL